MKVVAGSWVPYGKKSLNTFSSLGIELKQVDFKSKLTKTFVGSSAGLADTSANTATKHTRASALIFKDVDEVTLVFFAYKNALVA